MLRNKPKGKICVCLSNYKQPALSLLLLLSYFPFDSTHYHLQHKSTTRLLSKSWKRLVSGKEPSPSDTVKHPTYTHSLAPHQTAGVELDSRAPPSYQDPNANNANVPSPGPVPVNSPPPVHSMPPQGQYVPQQQGQQPNVPLNMLQSQSVPVVCPSCGTYGPSNAMAESGGFTQ